MLIRVDYDLFTLSLTTFQQVYLISKEVSYLPGQSKYSNLNANCHIKSSLFFVSKPLEK